MAHMQRHVKAGLRSFLLIAVMLSAAPIATWAENQPSRSTSPPAPAIQSGLSESDIKAIESLLQDIRKRSRPHAEYATVQYPPPDPSREDLQQLVKALKKIDPYLQKTLIYIFQYSGHQTFFSKAVALDVLRFLQPPREIALPYYEREVKMLSARDYYLMETVVRGMLQFGGPNPESRIPLVDRLETHAEFIRERAMQEFRTLPTSEQETIISALRKRWADPTYKPGEEKVDSRDTLLRLAAQRSAERLVSFLKPNTILISCAHCETEGRERSVDHVFLVQSAKVTLDTQQHSARDAEQFGRYTVQVTGLTLAAQLPLDPSRKHLMDQTAHCWGPGSVPHEEHEPVSDNGTDNNSGKPQAPDSWIISLYETSTLYALSSIHSEDIPGWIGAPWTVGKPTIPATLPFSERDRKKLADCEQLRHEVMPTSQSILASIKEAGGTIVDEPVDYGAPTGLVLSHDQFFGSVGPGEGITKMHIQSNTLTPQGLKTLQGFCRPNGPSFFITSFNSSGQAACHKLVNEDGGYTHILSLKLSGAITQAADTWNEMLLSRKSLPPQTWRTRPSSPEEQQLAQAQANRHLGALGRRDPMTYEFKVIEAKDGRQVIILPLHTDGFTDSSSTTYLALIKEQGKWKTLYGFEEDMFDPFVDIDGDGFPEFFGTWGYKNVGIWRLLPNFQRLFQRLGG